MDIRVNTALAKHPKVRAVGRALGVPTKQVVGMLVCLWMDVADIDPEGTHPMISEDVDIAAGRVGFCEAAWIAGLVDEVDGGFVCHDWAENQGWVVHARKRSEQARRAAHARHAQRSAPSKGAGQQPCSKPRRALLGAPDSCSEHKSDAPSSAPSPSPSPSPPPSGADFDKSLRRIQELTDCVGRPMPGDRPVLRLAGKGKS